MGVDRSSEGVESVGVYIFSEVRMCLWACGRVGVFLWVYRRVGSFTVGVTAGVGASQSVG